MFRKKNQSEISIREILRGMAPGRIQSVGYMQVIPLISDLSDDRFVSPSEANAEVYTTEYGTLGFRNPANRIMIVPCHAGYVVSQKAQNHAMTHSGIVKRQGDQTFTTAACIQASQGGFIKRGAYRMLILPFALRERALETRDKKNYQKLWDDISAFNASFGLTASGHLEFFLKEFRKELDEFVAEFESVPGQIGAIILVDDEVVGIERAPSHAYWNDVWPSLIRECYGSLALSVGKLKESVQSDTDDLHQSRTPLPSSIQTLDELELFIAEMAAAEDERTRSLVRELLDKLVAFDKDSSKEGLTVNTVKSDRFAGQIVCEGDQVVYASLPVSQAWLKNAKWQNAAAFSI